MKSERRQRAQANRHTRLVAPPIERPPLAVLACGAGDETERAEQDLRSSSSSRGFG